MWQVQRHFPQLQPFADLMRVVAAHISCLQRLDAAAQLEQRMPSYYGAAWVALGRIMLTTSMLGDCHSAR